MPGSALVQPINEERSDVAAELCHDVDGGDKVDHIQHRAVHFLYPTTQRRAVINRTDTSASLAHTPLSDTFLFWLLHNMMFP